MRSTDRRRRPSIEGTFAGVTQKGEEQPRFRAYVLRGSTSRAGSAACTPARLFRFHAARLAGRSRRRKMARNTGGKRGDVRQSAPWGSGDRGGEFRSNALWGKGGRGLVTSVVAIALAVPLAAGAGGGKGSNSGPGSGNGNGYVSHQLKQMAKTHPNEPVSVIVQMNATVSSDDAKRAEDEMRKRGGTLELINGFEGGSRAQTSGTA